MSLGGAMPRCAVVLCSYNGERFLPAQLCSLRAQTFQPQVYVLSDDASSDGSWTLLQAFAEERIGAGCTVVLHRNQTNLGYVRHFEQALQRADAEVLFPCDQDDVWHPRKIELMTARFAARPRLWMLHGDARLVDAEGKPSGRRLFDVLEVTSAELQAMHEGRAFDVLLRRNIVTGAAMALRRELLVGAFPVGKGWSHDEWLAILAAMCGEADTLEDVVIDYRQHGANQIGVREKLGLQKLGVGMDRGEFLHRAASRWQALQRHVAAHVGFAAHADDIAQRLRHAQLRAAHAQGGLNHLGSIMREWMSGRYSRFGSGTRSALADLLGVD